MCICLHHVLIGLRDFADFYPFLLYPFALVGVVTNKSMMTLDFVGENTNEGGPIVCITDKSD